jgi:hypothetical protein
MQPGLSETKRAVAFAETGAPRGVPATFTFVNAELE